MGAYSKGGINRGEGVNQGFPVLEIVENCKTDFCHCIQLYKTNLALFVSYEIMHKSAFQRA